MIFDLSYNLRRKTDRFFLFSLPSMAPSPILELFPLPSMTPSPILEKEKVKPLG